MIQLMSKTGMLLIALVFSINSIAQISNAQTTTVKISGNCDMCQSAIEKAGSRKNTAKVSWDKATKMATITYDSKQTNADEILKRIALAGYDNEKFLAPDGVYTQLPECCRYNRVMKPASKSPGKNTDNQQGHQHATSAQAPAAANATQLKATFDHYFSVKDALVDTDGKAAAAHAAELLKSLKDIDMAKLSPEEHTVWMRVGKALISEAEKIAATKDISKQRENFVLLSKNMYALGKVSRQATPVYYQHCPMYAEGKGANWLSREVTVKNPYYGAQMLTCGKTIETIQ